jgi:GNAT superfamily N-acetyltransferase
VDAAAGPVEIPIDLIVSGKPVPPRPSMRMRVSARDAEVHAHPLWPGVDRTPLGEWELRLDPAPAGRLLKRANSCLAMGSPGLPFAQAEACVREFYAAHDRVPMVQVEAGSAVEADFLAARWDPLPVGESAFLLASTAQLRRALPADDDARLDADGPRAVATIDDVASAHGAVDGDWIGLHGIEVAPSHRRRGLATRLVAALVRWGAEQGATTAWLHVETDNAAGRGLYDALGFAEHHRCRYLTPLP